MVSIKLAGLGIVRTSRAAPDPLRTLVGKKRDSVLSCGTKQSETRRFQFTLPPMVSKNRG